MSGPGLPTPLRDRLLEEFRRESWAPMAEEEFNELAMAAFAFQRGQNPVFGRFVEARGLERGSVTHWTAVPMVPTTAFKRLPLVCGDPASAEATFRTSGTTGVGDRGTHHVLDLALYHGSLLPNFRRHLLPEGGRMRMLSLVSDAKLAPESSLGHMMAVVIEEFGDGCGGVFADGSGRLRVDPFASALAEAESEGLPVLVAGTAFAFVHWIEVAEEGGLGVRLAEGSRVMETGGFKGRSRDVSRERLYAGLEATLGVPASRIVNEYGMTEMCSQFYEPVLAGGESELVARKQVPPPWVRTRVLDPVTLQPLEPGRPGLLAHYDLANLGSVCHLLTEDLGVAVEGGFRLLGRAPGAEPRGCSLTMEALMRSQEAEDW